MAILKGNATYIDLITRGEWGVNLNLKENEWRLEQQKGLVSLNCSIFQRVQ